MHACSAPLPLPYEKQSGRAAHSAGDLSKRMTWSTEGGAYENSVSSTEVCVLTFACTRRFTPEPGGRRKTTVVWFQETINSGETVTSVRRLRPCATAASASDAGCTSVSSPVLESLPRFVPRTVMMTGGPSS